MSEFINRPLSRRGFLGGATVVAGLGLTACGGQQQQKTEAPSGKEGGGAGLRGGGDYFSSAAGASDSSSRSASSPSSPVPCSAWPLPECSGPQQDVSSWDLWPAQAAAPVTRMA